ncbi:MAG: DUF3276 family protein [Bacteroidota bacterium]
MEEKEYNKERSDHGELFSKIVRAGKRTYFIDVKQNRSNEDFYLTITESKRRFSEDQGKFFYEKHKLFLYHEDFEKFLKGLTDTMHFVETGEQPEPDPEEYRNGNEFTDLNFEDLDNNDPNHNK